jgi:hypothetical protein
MRITNHNPMFRTQREMALAEESELDMETAFLEYLQPSLTV